MSVPQESRPSEKILAALRERAKELNCLYAVEGVLRRVDDRGVVAVLDSRMATARYGGYLRASLPPFWSTTDSQRAKQALQRLRGGTAE